MGHINDMNQPVRACQYLKDFKVGTRILTPITILVALLWVFVIAGAAYSKVFETEDNPRLPGPPIYWGEKDFYYGCSGGQILNLFLGVAVETVHLPIHWILYARNLLHPIAALVLAICLSGVWTFQSVGAIMFDMCSETTRPDVWLGLLYTREAFHCLLAILYLVYIGVSAAAIHKWRKGGKKVSSSV